LKAGKEGSGTSKHSTSPKQVAPGGRRLPFTSLPPAPLLKVSGGHFQTAVSVAGYTEVFRQTKSRRSIPRRAEDEI
jgi:hypothetical protein